MRPWGWMVAWVVCTFPVIALPPPLALLGLGVIAWWVWRGELAGMLVAWMVAASVVVACASHAGVLLGAWVLSGVALTRLVRQHGGETSGKPGRVMEIQQHAASVLLFALTPLLVAAAQDWTMDVGSPLARARVDQILSGAGIRCAGSRWVTGSAWAVAAIASLRLGLFPFPFSLRRSTRRLSGVPLVSLLAAFMPSSAVAVVRLSQQIRGGEGLDPVLGFVGCVALLTGGCWLRVEWLAESMAGHVSQCMTGLILLASGCQDRSLVVGVATHAALAALVGGAWSSLLRRAGGSSDLAKVAARYRTLPELAPMHAVFVLVSCPIPGTPAGRAWMELAATALASGSPGGLLIIAGVCVWCWALLDGLRRVGIRMREEEAHLAHGHS